MAVLISDTECFPNLWSIGFKRVDDGKVVVLEKSERAELDRLRLERIIRGHRAVGFNWRGYDLAMVWAAIQGWSNERLKQLNDQIIVGRIPWWRIEEDALGFRIPRTDYIDLIEPQPNAIASLKTLNGRLHGRQMQDLPYSPDRVLTHAEMDHVISYMGNDLDATHLLYHALAEPLALREAISADLKLDVRSKSDTQVGFAILKKRVEQATGERLGKPPMAGKTFRYRPPDFIRFETPELRAMLDRIVLHDFRVKANGKVDLPSFLTEPVAIGNSVYRMGLGGLHSSEANRTIRSNETHVLIDADVASYYPAIILGLGLSPPAMGPKTLPVYDGIRRERLAAKAAKDKSKAESLKLSLNGFFGLTSQPHSPAYSPPMTIAITLTGQLSLLMLIEWAQAAGIGAVSGNTDGVTFLCPRLQANPINDDGTLFGCPEIENPRFGVSLKEVTDQWQKETGFDLEFVEYASLHNRSVNDYFAIKPDGKVKRKGKLGNWWAENAMRDILMHNPNMTICSDAALAFIKDGVAPETTVRACRDIRQFVTVVNVRGGGTWRGDYLGKVVRFVWSKDGDPILYKDPHPSTGNFKKVSKTDGCRPMMRLEDELPGDLDYDRYVAEAYEILVDVGHLSPQAPPAPRGTVAVPPVIRGYRNLLRALILVD